MSDNASPDPHLLRGPFLRTFLDCNRCRRGGRIIWRRRTSCWRFRLLWNLFLLTCRRQSKQVQKQMSGQNIPTRARCFPSPLPENSECQTIIVGRIQHVHTQLSSAPSKVWTDAADSNFNVASGNIIEWLVSGTRSASLVGASACCTGVGLEFSGASDATPCAPQTASSASGMATSAAAMATTPPAAAAAVAGCCSVNGLGLVIAANSPEAAADVAGNEFGVSGAARPERAAKSIENETMQALRAIIFVGDQNVKAKGLGANCARDIATLFRLPVCGLDNTPWLPRPNTPRVNICVPSCT